VRSHGDFWARNLLLNGSNAASGVVDWEQCQAGAPAFNDMFHFVVTYGLAFRWPGRPSAEAAFHRTFFERNWVSTMVKRSLARYCLRSGLTLAALPAALAVYLARQHRAARTSPDMRPTGDQDVWIRCLKVLATAERSAFYGSSIP
jgi:aminoglycoside phosphotransferase (APT) family kinase protein